MSKKIYTTTVWSTLDESTAQRVQPEFWAKTDTAVCSATNNEID